MGYPPCHPSRTGFLQKLGWLFIIPIFMGGSPWMTRTWGVIVGHPASLLVRGANLWAFVLSRPFFWFNDWWFSRGFLKISAKHHRFSYQELYKGPTWMIWGSPIQPRQSNHCWWNKSRCTLRLYTLQLSQALPECLSLSGFWDEGRKLWKYDENHERLKSIQIPNLSLKFHGHSSFIKLLNEDFHPI